MAYFSRRFPQPLVNQDNGACFNIRDANGQALGVLLAYIGEWHGGLSDAAQQA